MSDSNATERFTTLCAALTEFEDAAMTIRIEASDTQAREEVWRNAIGDLAREYATEIEGMFTPGQAVEATLERGICEMETDWDYLYNGIPDAPEDTWAYMCGACGWSFRYDRGIKPKYCPECGRKVIDS